MPITWKGGSKFKPDLILKRIEKSRSVNSDGVASFHDFGYTEGSDVIETMLNFPKVSEDINKASLVTTALFKSRPDLSPHAFLEAINTELTYRLSKREESYYLASSLSFRCDQLPKKIALLDATIQFYTSGYPNRFKSRDLLLEKNRFLEREKDASHYLPVAVKVLSKSYEQAAHKAFERIDLFRAIVNLNANPVMQMSFGSSHQPINVVRQGPTHTLHKPNGVLATDGVWHDQTYVKANPNLLKDPEIHLRNVRYVTKIVKKSKLGAIISDALIRYARAFDEPDPSVAFLRLWTALELLMTPDIADYDKLVDRCAFLFMEHEYHRQILLHLREYRNRSVHPGESVRQSRTNCFHLQRYFNAAIKFLIFNRAVFHSLSEVHDFLSLPPNLTVIKKRQFMLARAAQFMSHQESG